MTSVLLLTPACGVHLDAVEPRPVRLRDRVAARVRAFDLDRRLAEGVPPERSAPLALRARRLVEPRYGERLARRLHGVVNEAIFGAPRRRASIPLRLDAVAAVSDEIDDLARRLVAPGAAAVRGIALVGLLLCDGAGPLYSARGEDLGAAVRRARAALEVV